MHEPSPTISIIIPVFNGEQYLEACLDSLLAQTFQDLEVIVVDDASTDRSIEVAERKCSADARIKLIRQTENVGAFKARSIGVEHSCGPYVGFVDCDDRVQPTMYQELLNAIEESNADIALCGAVEESGHRIVGYRARFSNTRVQSRNIFEAFCSGALGTNALWNKLYRRRSISKYVSLPLGWRQDLSEDAIINIGCFSEARRIVLLDKTLYRYASNKDSVTQVRDSLAIYIELLRAYALALSHYRTLGEEKLALVTEMFGYRMLEVARTVDSYQLSSGQREQVAQAMEIAAEIYPQGVPLLFNSDWNTLPRAPSVRASLSSLASSLGQLYKAVMTLFLRRR